MSDPQSDDDLRARNRTLRVCLIIVTVLNLAGITLELMELMR